MKKDIPLDQAVALVRACQKLNCDTAEQLFAMVERRCEDAKIARAALEPFANIALAQDGDKRAADMISGPDLAITPNQVRAARKALGHKIAVYEYRTHKRRFNSRYVRRER